MKLSATTLALLATLLASAPAFAGDKALAESLFREGRKLMEADNPAAACPKFEASNREDPSAGTMLNLAMCYEKLGKTASAWAQYKETVVKAKAQGRDAHAAKAREAAEKLEGKLSKLTIEAPAVRPQGYVIRRGDVELSSGAFGLAVAVDPGTHVIEASAPGYVTYRTEVTVGANADTKSILVPDLERDPSAAAKPPDSSSSSAASGDVRADTSGGDNKMLGYVLTGAGGVVLATGLTMGFLAQKQASDAEDDPALCPNKQCTPKGREEIDGAETKALISTIGVGVGAVALGAGIYFLVTSSSDSAAAQKKATATRFVPMLSPHGGGLGVSGAF